MKDKWIELDIKIFSDEEFIKKREEFEEIIKKYDKRDSLNKNTEEDLDKMSLIRGGIIASLVEVEHSLSIFLSNYFCDDVSSIEFYEKILSKEFFTMHQKIRLFKEIAYHRREKYSNKYDGLSGILFCLNKLRNLVAHGVKFPSSEIELSPTCFQSSVRFDSKLNARFRNAVHQVLYSLENLEDDLIEEQLQREIKNNIDMGETI